MMEGSGGGGGGSSGPARQQPRLEACGSPLDLLPDGLLQQILLRSGPTQRHLASLARVCRAWRALAGGGGGGGSATANLRSDAAAASLREWLAAHGRELQRLQLATVGLYSRHCHPPTQLALFRALHEAAGGSGPSEAAAAADDEDAEDANGGSGGGGGSSSDGGAAADRGSCGGVVGEAAAGGGSGAARQPSGWVGGGNASQATEAPEAAGAAAGGTAARGQQEMHEGPVPPHHQQQQQQQQQQPRPLRLMHLAAHMRLTPMDCDAIASLPAPELRSLELLGSRTRRLAPDGPRALVRLTQLTRLAVGQLGIGDDAAALLARHLTGLVELSLSGNNLGPAGAAGVASCGTRLERLDLSVNRIKDAGLSELCGSLRGLRWLSLSGNVRFAPSALQQLAQLAQLTGLEVASCGVCNAGLAAIAAAAPGLADLDVGSNRVSRVQPVCALAGLTRLVASRNALQIGCGKQLGGLSSLRELVLLEALPAKGVAGLCALGAGAALTALTLGADPSLHPDQADDLPLAPRKSARLLAALAGAGALSSLALPCAGLGDAGARLLPRLGGSLSSLNLSYNAVGADGLAALAQLPALRRLELRAMRPELGDEAAAAIGRMRRRLEALDVAYNDLSSDGLRRLCGGGMPALRHLNLRNNVQVEKEAILACAPHLTALTHLNLLELTDVSARAVPRGAAAPASGSSPVHPPPHHQQQPHADLWRALPNLQELVAGSYTSSNAFRTDRAVISCGG